VNAQRNNRAEYLFTFRRGINMYTRTLEIAMEWARIMKKSRIMFFLFAVYMSWFGYSSVVYAQTSTLAPKLCIPHATGVPYWGLPPDWITNYSDLNQERLAKSFDTSVLRTGDPRWRGALSIDYGAGATDPAEFRALFDNTNRKLLLSWSSKTMPFNLSFTSMVLGIKIDGVTTIIQATVDKATTENSGRIVPEASGSGAAAYISWNMLNSGAMPSWLADTRIWIKPINFGGVFAPAFTLQAKIPVPANVNNVSMWYSLQPSVPNQLAGDDPMVTAFTWPRGSFDEWGYYQDMNGNNHIPAENKWGKFYLGDHPDCAGVSLATDDIGVENSQFPGSRSQISINDATLNTFYALPKNKTGGNLDMSKIKATFYFANWGSQRGDLTGNSWSEIFTQLNEVSVQPSGSTPVFMDPDLYIQGANIGDPASIPTGKKAQISPATAFVLSKAEKCKFFVEGSDPPKFLAEVGNPDFCAGMPTSSINPHGCMLVKLNGPMEFLQDSALKNMDFMSASKAQRVAEISTIEGKRDVYLFVDRRNMPLYSERNKDPKVTPTQIPICGQLNEIHDMLSQGIVPNMTIEEVSAVMPTYVVHAFYDTGKKVLINGKPHLVMDQQTSFGYWMRHEGALFGWNDTLTGADSPKTVKKLGNDIYKVNVPDNGSVRIINTIEAVERPLANEGSATGILPDDDRLEWWNWFLLFLIIILNLFNFLGRKSR